MIIHVLCCLPLSVFHVQGLGDTTMAYRCFKLALSANNNHAEAYNNLGVLEWRRGRGEQVSVHVTMHIHSFTVIFTVILLHCVNVPLYLVVMF